MDSMIKDVFKLLKSPAPSPPFLEGCSKLVIYGAGNMGKEVFKVLNNHGIPVICFLDRKAQPGDQWNGVPILHPDDEHILPTDKKKISVVIAIHNRSAEIPPIIHKLNACGYVRIVTLVELYDYFGKELGNRYWLTSRSYYQSPDKVITDGLSVWSDAASRSLYASILNFRFTENYSILSHPDTEHQYFPLDISKWKTPLRFVDLGAFDGNTLASLSNMNIPVEAVAEF